MVVWVLVVIYVVVVDNMCESNESFFCVYDMWGGCVYVADEWCSFRLEIER